MTHGHVHEVLRAGKSGTVEIVGFAEPNRDLAMRLVHQYGYDSTLIYASLDEMLAQTQPELVAAYNSIFQHLEVVEACAPKGIHVMVGKAFGSEYGTCTTHERPGGGNMRFIC